MTALISDPRPASWTAAQIRHLLHERHPAPEWAFYAELSDATGHQKVRSFDGWAMNVYPSSNFVTVGYEIKVTRKDFARELLNPGKRGPMEAVSNEVFFVAPAGLLKPDEVPQHWGLLEATNGEEPKLRVKKHATARTIDPLPRDFIASLARRSADPPPPLPVAAWKVAGRPLRLADVDRLVAARAKQLRQVENREFEYLRRELERARNRTGPGEKLVTVVSEVLGWQAVHDPELVRQALRHGSAASSSDLTPADRLALIGHELDRLADHLRRSSIAESVSRTGGDR